MIRPARVHSETMQLTDVMATTIVSVPPETGIGDAARRMVEADIGAAVVFDDAGELAGVITERDLLRCVSEGLDPATPVELRMTRHVLTTGPDTGIAEAMAAMVDGHFRHLPVVNDDGQVIGMVSMRDLMAYTSLRLRGGSLGAGDDLDPAEIIATIFRMRTGAA
jgi:CBS domain-containing protein